MEIALVTEHADPRRGGAETSVRQFIGHLTQLGIHIELYTTSSVPSDDGLRVHRIDTSRTAKLFRTLNFSRQVDEDLTSGRLKIIHAITPCRAATIYEPRGGAIPEAVSRNLALRRTPLQRTLKRVTNRFNLKLQRSLRLEGELLRGDRPPIVIALSDYVADQFARHYKLGASRIRRIFNGVDHTPQSAQRRTHDRQSIRSLFGIGADEPLALFVAHNLKLKGLRAWLDALRILKRRGRNLIQTIVVSKADAWPYHRLAQATDVADRVHFAGPSQSVSAFYHAADLLVHPTYFDPCSRVVLEAMLHGLPCLTTRFNGAAEIIQDGVDGRVIESPDDVENLATAAEELAAPRFRSALEERHEHLRSQLSMKRHAQEVVALYEEVMSHES